MKIKSDLRSSGLVGFWEKYFVALYFGVLLLVIGYYTFNGYIHLSVEKGKLASAIKTVEEVDAYYPQAKENLLVRVIPFAVSARDRNTLQLLQGRLAAIGNELKTIQIPKISDANPDSQQEFYKKTIENELLLQEREYLAWLQQLVRARNNSDALGKKGTQLLARHQAVYGQLQATDALQNKTSIFALQKQYGLYKEHFRLYEENHQAAVKYQNNAAELQKEGMKAAQLQNFRGQFVVEEARVQALVAPLYADIYQIREAIKSHWLTRALQPMWFGVPLVLFVALAFIVSLIIANIGLGFLDHRAAMASSKSAYLFKMVAALVVICSVPVLLIQMNISFEKAKMEKTNELVRAKVDQAEGAEKRAIELRAAELAQQLLSLSGNESGIKSFTGDMLSLKAIWSSVQGKDEYTKRVTDSFYRHIISGEDLQTKLKIAATLCQKDIEAIENELFVSVGPIDYRHDETGLGGLQRGYEISASIERIADKSRRGDWAVAATTAATLPISIIGGLVADLAVGKLVTDGIEEKVKEEIATLSDNARNQLSGKANEYVRLRNAEFKNQLGAQI